MFDSSIKPVLIMGAGGSVGTHVLNGLLARGIAVRASARKPQPGRFPAGVDVVAADLTDAASLSAAFDGVRRVFLYANREGVRGVIDAARGNGVEQIVLMSSGSVLHPSSAGNAITEEHRMVEEAFAAAADLSVVPIRPLVLATNASGWAHSITAGGTLPLYKPDAVTAPIHEQDVADVVIAALTGAGGAEVSGLLTGPARLSQRDQVAAIAAAAGRVVEVQELSREEALARFSRFLPVKEAEAVLEFLDDADAGNSPATSAVQDILGRSALDFARWATDHAAEFV